MASVHATSDVIYSAAQALFCLPMRWALLTHAATFFCGRPIGGHRTLSWGRPVNLKGSRISVVGSLTDGVILGPFHEHGRSCASKTLLATLVHRCYPVFHGRVMKVLVHYEPPSTGEVAWCQRLSMQEPSSVLAGSRHTFDVLRGPHPRAKTYV